jgi:hypothetical protein
MDTTGDADMARWSIRMELNRSARAQSARYANERRLGEMLTRAQEELLAAQSALKAERRKPDFALGFLAGTVAMAIAWMVVGK